MKTVGSIEERPQAAASRFSEQDKLRLQRAVREFEAVFVGYLLKSMKSTVPDGGLGGNALGGDMLGSIAEMEFAREIARTSSFGLGEMLYRQMTGEPLPPPRPVRLTPVAPPDAEERIHDDNTTAGPTPPLKQATAPETLFPGSRAPVRLPTAVAARVNTFTPYVNEAAERHNLDPRLIKAVIAAESGGRPDASSPGSAKGLMQLIDSTAAEMGVRNIWDPRENILAGARYLRHMLDRFGGNTQHALASYNAGPGAVERHGGVPPFRETREYINRVETYLTMFGQEDQDGND